MCGIVGYITRKKGGAHFSQFENRALSLLEHRGPDDLGSYRFENIWLGHTRLSILDLSSRAHQPMQTSDERFVLTYNGEIYNYRDLVGELGLKDFASNGDSEVLLKGFESIREALFPKLNGMFAFAVLDKKENQFWLVRDRLGIKPLYYYENKDCLLFASELPSLLALLGRVPRVDLSSMHEWWYYGNALGERTHYQGIKQLLPGHFLRFNTCSFEYVVDAYWSLQKEASVTGRLNHPSNELMVQTRNLLEQAVTRQLVSDVPIGVFLSGGVDSSAITAFASRNYQGKLITFSAGFDDPHYSDERPLARKIANHFGTEHYELQVGGKDLPSTIELLVDHHGSPFGDAANIPLYLMSKEIKGAAKVVLQGDGGDEVFGGYRRYATLRLRRLLYELSGAGKMAATALPNSPIKQRILRYCNIYGQKDLSILFGLLLTTEGIDAAEQLPFMGAFKSAVETYNPLSRYIEIYKKFSALDIGQQMSMIDLSIELPDIFLEKVDRATMAAGLEVRVPFLDNDLIEFAAHIPGYVKMPFGQKKWLLKEALRGVVPDYVLDGPKRGFGVPIKYWLLEPLQDHFNHHLDIFNQNNPEILSLDRVNKWHYMTKTGAADFSPRLWKVYNLCIWANRFKVEFNI